jgi:hypothetical protein
MDGATTRAKKKLDHLWNQWRIERAESGVRIAAQRQTIERVTQEVMQADCSNDVFERLVGNAETVLVRMHKHYTFLLMRGVLLMVVSWAFNPLERLGTRFNQWMSTDMQRR